MDYETTVDIIKSCIVSVKGGLPLRALKADFESISGEVLDYRRLGYPTIQDLLISIEEVYLQGNLLTVRDHKTEHLSKLISKQKGQTKIKAVKKSSTSSASLRGGNVISMRKGPTKALREQTKKLVAERDRLYPAPPPSNSSLASTSSNAYRQEGGNLKNEFFAPLSASNGSLSSSTTSASGFPSADDRNLAKGSAGRGRGRGWGPAHPLESPGGLGATATPKRDTSSPDIRSGVNSTSSLSGTAEEKEPVLLKFQLIGEGLLRKVASLILGYKDEEFRLCCETLDIATCLKKLKRGNLCADKVILMIGLTDIVKGKDLDTIKQNLQELLNYLRTRAKEILILTLPVPMCLQKMQKPRKTLTSYNEWLLSLKFPQVRAVDLAPYTQNKDKETLDFLCESATKKPTVPWNETACWAFVEALFFCGIQL